MSRRCSTIREDKPWAALPPPAAHRSIPRTSPVTPCRRSRPCVILLLASLAPSGMNAPSRAAHLPRTDPGPRSRTCRGVRPDGNGIIGWVLPEPATRWGPRRDARAGRRCTRTTRCFDEERREADEQRFWFWNSMHFPLPMPAFDAICIDTAYQALGSWQNRVFAVPPAMGIDYRCINGYIYISGNPVTDPAKIAERAGHFQQRAGYYFENWDELYAEWRTKMEALIAELEALEVPQLARARARRGRVRRPGDELLRRPRRLPPGPAARRPDVAAPLRVPAPRLRRVRHLRRALQGAPAGHPGPAHRADGRGAGRAPVPAGRRAPPPGAARDRHGRRRGVRRGPVAGRDRGRARPRASAAASGSRSSRRSRTRGSTWRRATASTTTTAAGSTIRRSRTPR